MCNGQTISADDYPELVKALGSNVLPNLNGRVLQGAETAGEYKEAGLPNITGAVSSDCRTDEGSIKQGALSFSAEKGKYTTLDNMGDNEHKAFTFNASLSNPIYGASTTVQPPAYTVKFYICWG